MSVLGILGMIFVVLKLLGVSAVAAWSWWWVTAPFWGGIAVWALFAFLMMVFAVFFRRS